MPASSIRVLSAPQVHVPGAAVQSFRTATVTDNGFNPVFGGDPLGPFTAPDAEAAFLRVAVHDEDVAGYRVAAVACLPLAALRPGVRHLPLLHPDTGAALPLTGVLCRFAVEGGTAPKASPLPAQAAAKAAAPVSPAELRGWG